MLKALFQPFNPEGRNWPLASFKTVVYLVVSPIAESLKYLAGIL